MDFEHARYNMIEQQIRPWNVLDQDILDLLSVVHREDFVPPAYRTMAFTDMEVPLTVGGRVTGECMLAPKVEARILQELGVRKHESVLEIGTGSGHMAALLAHRGRHVDTLEIDADLALLNPRRRGLHLCRNAACIGAWPDLLPRVSNLFLDCFVYGGFGTSLSLDLALWDQ